MAVAIASVLGASVSGASWSAPARAQSELAARDQSRVVELSSEGCEQSWANPMDLARQLRVELASANLAVRLAEEAQTNRAEVSVRIQCDEAARVQLSGRWGEAERSQAIDLTDTPEPARIRTLALLVADISRHLITDGSRPSEPESELEVEHAQRISVTEPAAQLSEPLQELPADEIAQDDTRSSLAPSAGSDDPARSPTVGLIAGAEGWVVTADPRVFVGGRLGVEIDSILGFLRLGAAVGAQGAGGQDELGGIDLYLINLALRVGASTNWHSVSLGGLLEARPGLVVAIASSSRPGVSASNGLEVVFDLSLLARLDWMPTAGWSIGLEAGLGYAIRSYEGKAGDRRVVGWSDWLVPVRLTVTVALP